MQALSAATGFCAATQQGGLMNQQGLRCFRDWPSPKDTDFDKTAEQVDLLLADRFSTRVVKVRKMLALQAHACGQQEGS